MAKVTIAKIAKNLGLSPTTVSFVLNDNQDKGISDKTRKLVIDKAIELGYRKPVKVNMLDWTRVGFFTSNIQFFNFGTTFFAGVYSHLQAKSFKNKIELFLLELNLQQSSEEVYNRTKEIKSMGIEVCLTNCIQIAEFLKKEGLKTIITQGGRHPGHICIYCDDYTAGKKAAEYAWKSGHKEAGIIFPEHSSSPRLHGFLDRYRELGGRCDKEFLWFLTFDHEIMAEKIKELSQNRKDIPSLFYCFADNVMFPAIKGFTANGFKIPDDISLIGTDNLYWGKIATPAFTTVDLNEEIFANKTIEAIKHAKKGDEPYELAVPVKFLPRETVKIKGAPH
jgi:LacI family transcriptional regulator